MTDFIWIEYGYSTNFAGCESREKIKVDRQEWESKTEEEKESWLDELATEYRNENCDCWAFVVGEDE